MKSMNAWSSFVRSKPPVAINPKRREFFGLGAMPSAISSKSTTLIQQIQGERPQ